MSKEKPEISEMILALKRYRYSLDEQEVTDAADRLYDHLEPKLRIFIFGKAHSVDARDILQETMKGIFKDLLKFRGNSTESLWAWCYRIARNKTNDHMRKHFSSRIEPLPPEELDKLVQESEFSYVLPLAEKLDCEYALDLLAKAKPQCREYLWNRFIVDMDYYELADQYDLDYDTLRRRIERCLKTLRALIPAGYE